MADTNIDDVREELEKQIASLKKDLSRVSKALAAKASETADDAEEAMGLMSGRARDAMHLASRQAYHVGEVIRRDPGTATTMIAVAGLGGLLLGLMIAARPTR